MATIIVTLLVASLISQAFSVCDDSDEVLAEVCYKLYNQVRNALLGDEGNLYRLRKAFFYSPNANPVLLKVVYNISFADNVTAIAQSQPNYCISASEVEDNDTMSFNHTQFVFGWTSSGVFTVFHPLTINFMQIQLPFALMRIMFAIFRKIDPTESGPEAKTFLWDGSYELPTLHINLHFTALPCIPTVHLFNSALMDFNSLVRVYAGQAITGVVQDSENTHYVGFSLPRNSVSPQDITADIGMYLGYVLSSIVLYVTCIATIRFLVSKSDKKGVEQYFTEKHPEVLLGVGIIVSVFIILEIFTELIMAIIWSINVQNSLMIFIIFSSALVYFMPLIASIIMVMYDSIRHTKTKSIGDTPSSPIFRIFTKFKCSMKNNITFEIFVCAIAYFVYIVLYSFFPAFVLAFAYPTRIITSFTFIFAFMVLSVVYITTYVKYVYGSMSKWKNCKGRYKLLISSLSLTIVLLYFFLFIFALLYSLVIGRASVVSSAPLAVLSLLPTILISIAAWIMKSTMLKNTNSKDDSQKNNTDTEQRPVVEIPLENIPNEENRQTEAERDTNAETEAL